MPEYQWRLESRERVGVSCRWTQATIGSSGILLELAVPIADRCASYQATDRGGDRRASPWVDRIDGGCNDIFDLQDKVASRVAGAIVPALQAAETAWRAQRLRGPCAVLRCYSHWRIRCRRRLSYWKRRSHAIQITVRLLPRTAACGSAWTASKEDAIVEKGSNTPGEHSRGD